MLTLFLALLCLFGLSGVCNARRRHPPSGGSNGDSNGDRDDNKDNDNGQFSDLFTYDEYAEISRNKRIRREIRDLSCEEWNRVVIAMNIMKQTSEEEGQLIYGSDYRSYDSLVCQHMRFTRHSLGDLGHLGPHFLVVHRAFVLAFENSLLAIDPTIDGAPYWNYYIDLMEYGADLTDSIIFSDDYFGDFTGNEEFGYAIANGKFKFWKVNDNPNELQCNATYRNAFGQLRQENNAENNKYITRIGGNTCNGKFTLWEDTSSVYDECLMGNYTDEPSFLSCMNFQVHASAHFAIGGTRPQYTNQTVDDWPSCISWHAAGTLAVNNVRKFALDYGCFDCPKSGDCIVGIDDTSCGECNVNDDNGGTCDIEGVSFTVTGDLDSQHIIGDFYDLSTSPNDAIFFAHHSNIDRYFMEWQLRHYDQRPYYGYPESGYETGINLDDIMASEYPFENLFGDNNNTGPYTYRDIFDLTDFIDAPYTYDTVIELIKTKMRLPL